MLGREENSESYEQPGANLHQLPRTIPMSLQGFGLCVAALAEVAHFRS